MKKRIAKKRSARVSRHYWLCFRRSKSQGNHLSEKQDVAWERSVHLSFTG